MSPTNLDGELRGRSVVLRPFRAEEMDAVWEGYQGLAPMIMPIVPDRPRLEKRILRSGEMVGGEIDLAIEADGRLIGTIQTHNAPPDGLRPGVFELGILIWGPADRGHGHGSEAVAMLTDWLFAEAGAHRVQASTSPENAPMRRSLERLGFLERGVVHRPGGECALYAVGAEEWRGRASDSGGPPGS